MFVQANTSWGAQSLKVLYASSAYALPTSVQEFLYSGFLLALKKHLSESEIKSILIQDQRPGKSAMEALEIAQDNLKSPPSALFGFPSTHESQLVAPLLKENHILTFFASSTNSNLSSMGPTIFSTSEDTRKAVQLFQDVIKSDFKGTKGLVLYFPEDYFSLDQKRVWSDVLTKDSEMKLDFYSVKAGADDPTLLQAVKDHSYLIITSFPTLAFDLLKSLNKNKIDVPIFTNSSWYKVNYELLSRTLSQKKKEVYMVDAWNRNSVPSKQFISDYKTAYHLMPNIEASIGYEEGLILSELIRRSKLDPNLTMVELLQKNLCFKESPVGDLCFDKSGGFAHRKINLIKIEKGRKRVLRSITS